MPVFGVRFCGWALVGAVLGFRPRPLTGPYWAGLLIFDDSLASPRLRLGSTLALRSGPTGRGLMQCLSKKRNFKKRGRGQITSISCRSSPSLDGAGAPSYVVPADSRDASRLPCKWCADFQAVGSHSQLGVVCIVRPARAAGWQPAATYGRQTAFILGKRQRLKPQSGSALCSRPVPMMRSTKLSGQNT